MKGLLIPIIWTVILAGCVATETTETNDEGNQIPEKVDFVNIAADFIKSRMTHANKFEVSQIENNILIEFQMDTSKIQDGDYALECFQIDPTSVVSGDLKSDSTMGFAIKCIWSPCEGNVFGIQWYTFSQVNGHWTNIPNDFGGGKFSDIENVVGIKNGLLTTEFVALNDSTMLHDTNSKRMYTYKLSGERFIRTMN